MVSLPFGRHKGRPLPEVPGDYLQWLCRACRMSSGLRLTVRAELARRGLEAPPMPAPGPKVPLCPVCGMESFAVGWQEDSNGGRRIRAECMRCGRWLAWLPMTEKSVRQADGNASKTPDLDALVRLQDLGVELQSDGCTAWVPWPDVKRVTPELLALIRKCSHQLARMIGRTRTGT
jgi:uncharacterized protein (DUF3820 family)